MEKSAISSNTAQGWKSGEAELLQNLLQSEAMAGLCDYQLWFNSPSHQNFQSEDGVPLTPVSYTFKTSASP